MLCCERKKLKIRGEEEKEGGGEREGGEGGGRGKGKVKNEGKSALNRHQNDTHSLKPGHYDTGPGRDRKL